MGRFRHLVTARSVTRWAAAVVVLSAGYLLWAADLTQPKPNDRYVTRVVNALMDRDHLLQHPLDDKIAQRAMSLLIKDLDPLKVYFTAADVQEFQAQATKLDDQLREGDIQFAYTMYQRFLTRIDERVELVRQLLASELDFTRQEVMQVEPDDYEFAATDAELRDRWRKRIKYQLLLLKASDKLEGAEAREKLLRRYTSFARRMHQTDSDELLEIYLTAFTSSHDPHTTYMSPSSLTNFRIQMRLDLEGIGAALKVDDEGYTVVTKILAKGAADKDGRLQVNDKIVSVGQATGEMVDVFNMKLKEVVKLIRGSAGTVVRLGVQPAEGGDTQVYTITRAKVELSDAEAKGAVFKQGRKANGEPYRIGVIDLPSFYMDMEAARGGRNGDYKSTTRDVRRILDNFRNQGVDAVVLDLRHNGGGSLTEAIDLTGLFIDQGPVVQVKDVDGRVQPYYDDNPGMAWRGPLVVMTSRFSASASEILAGAVQDYRRGLVVGDKATHGKGTVQSLMELGAQLFPRIDNPPNFGALKVTMQKFYRPSGDSTQKRGVAADVELPALSGHWEGIGESDLDYCVEWDRVPAARFADYGMTSPELRTRLQASSAVRVQQSEEFVKVQKDIARYRKQQSERSLPLSEKAFMARRAELDVDKAQEKLLEEQESDDTIQRDYYLDEVFALTVDYITALGQKQIAQAR